MSENHRDIQGAVVLADSTYHGVVESGDLAGAAIVRLSFKTVEDGEFHFTMFASGARLVIHDLQKAIDAAEKYSSEYIKSKAN